jgi:predicted HicB family RNase H-like nuclease
VSLNTLVICALQTLLAKLASQMLKKAASEQKILVAELQSSTLMKVRIPSDLHHAAQAASAKQIVSLNTLLVTGIQLYMKQCTSTAATSPPQLA